MLHTALGTTLMLLLNATLLWHLLLVHLLWYLLLLLVVHFLIEEKMFDKNS
jgi:hypothetical protein